VLHVLIKLHLAAIFVWRIAESEHVSNFLQPHIQREAVPDELKMLEMDLLQSTTGPAIMSTFFPKE
jgi:hypothetical protein